MDARWLILLAASIFWSRKPTTILADEKHPAFMPLVCGDDRTIVFISEVPGTPSLNIWKIDRNGQGLQQITYGNEDIFPACSNDSKWIYYRDGRAQSNRGRPTFWTRRSSFCRTVAIHARREGVRVRSS